MSGLALIRNPSYTITTYDWPATLEKEKHFLLSLSSIFSELQALNEVSKWWRDFARCPCNVRDNLTYLSEGSDQIMQI